MSIPPTRALAEGNATRGANQTGMRAYNERLILTILRSRGALPKAELARITGLSAQTVSVIMRKLEGEGLIEREAPVRGRVGQPSVPMRLAPNGAAFFGLKVGRRSLEMIVTDFMGQPLGELRCTHDYPTPEATVDFAHRAFGELRAGLPDELQSRIGGIGIAVPFQLWDWAEALGVPGDGMAAWRDNDIRAEIEHRCEVPVILQNDTSSACGAELVFGTGPKPQTFMYLYIGFFVGGGIVLDGRLYTGRSGNAGALGSMTIPAPSGGARQLLDVASLSVLERNLKAADLCWDHVWEDPEGWPASSEIVETWLREAGHGLAHAIAAASAVVDFELVLIDGWTSAAMRRRLIETTRDALLTLDTAGLALPEVRSGSLGPEARALGGAHLPLAERFLVNQAAFHGSA